MKSLHFCKRTLSLVLALIMLVSMATVGIVSTAAAETDVADTAAEVDTVETGATISSGKVLYLTPHNDWKSDNAWFAAYFYSASGNAWAKCEKVEAETSKTVYKATAPSGSWTNVIFTRMNPASTALSWDNTWNQTVNLTYDGTKNLFTITNPWNSSNESKGTGSWSSYTEPVEEVITPSGETTTIYFRAQSGQEWVTNDDANIFVYTNAGDAVQMDETIDTSTGYAMWSAKIDTAATKIDFYRASFFFDESNANKSTWGHWSTTATAKGEKTCYSISSSSAGSWIANDVATPDKKDIVNGWYGIWVDSLANQDINHMLKWHKVADNEYALYLPSYVNMDAVKVYTSFYDVKITGGAYTNKKIYKGAPNTLKLAAGTKYTLSEVKRTSGDSIHTYTLNVYHTTDTAALLMNTKVELFRGTVCGTGNPNDGSTDHGLMASDAWPSGSGINADNYVSEYKDGIKTKGTYYLYDESGALVNEDTVLDQIKGRGNSSFEASMRVYGKYAYNIKTGEKVELVEGATASKKWSLLANNVDNTMLRNTFIYDVADEIGVPFAPETRICDMYNNGNYLGSYIITEKIEYGKNTIMTNDALGNKIKNLDDEIEDANMTAYGYDGDDWTDENGYMIEDLMDYVEQVEGDYPAPSGKTYHYSYTDFDKEALKKDLEAGDLKCDDTLTAEMIDAMEYKTPEKYKKMNYLLEFELWSRYENECCWLVCPDTNQAIVCKYPETASQAVMEWVIDEWDAVHTAVYANNYETYSELIDVDSFAKMYLIQELGLNLDAGATSYYVHNVVGEGPDGQSKLFASPVWDYDWSFGSYTKYTKFIYNGSTTGNSGDMANPEQMFVKKKALKTDGDQPNVKHNYNFQAKLAQNEDFWADCQNIWTNTMTPVLYDFLDNDTKTDGGANADDSILLTELYPKFKSAALMNDARWGSVKGNDTDDWGTKDTDDYARGSMSFNYGHLTSSGSATSSYANTVYYLNDWTLARLNYMSSSNGNLYNKDMAYDIDGVTFEGRFDDLTGELTVTPVVETRKLGENDLTDDELEYTVYVDGKAYATQLLSDVPATVSLPAGTHNVYISVSPVAYPTIVEYSDNTEKYTFAADGGVVDLTVYFKSSKSLRYRPSVEVDGKVYEMVQTDICLGKNSTQSQEYYWYEASVPATLGSALSLKFTNSLAMYAEVTVDAVANKAYYFGCQNMNNGKVAVDLTDEDETVRNFYQSATTMIQPDANMAELAQTFVNGKTRALGDTDADGKLTIIDATTTQYALVGLTELGDTEQGLADYDLDGNVSIMDVTSVQLNLVAG